MKTKQEYMDTLVCITKEYYSTVRSPEEANKFNSYSRLFKELVDEHFEEEQETNLDHYFEDLLKTGGRYAFVNGKIKHCWGTRCCDCVFNGGNCHKEQIKWLASPYEKPIYKLTQCEYDLLNAYKNSGMRQCISNYGTLLELYKKGYFKDIGTSIPIHEILDNYEVIQ